MLPPFYQDTTFFFIPYYGNKDNPYYNDTSRKERELSILPSSTVLVYIPSFSTYCHNFHTDFFCGKIEPWVAVSVGSHMFNCNLHGDLKSLAL